MRVQSDINYTFGILLIKHLKYRPADCCRLKRTERIFTGIIQHVLAYIFVFTRKFFKIFPVFFGEISQA